MARHDQLQDPAQGPDGALSETEQPSRGQYATIATLACELLGQPLTNRAEASEAIVRLHLARKKADDAIVPTVEPVIPF